MEVFLKSIGHFPVYLKGGNGNKRRGRSSACCELSFVQHTHVCPFKPNLLKVQYLNVFSATPEVLAVAAATAVGGGGVVAVAAAEAAASHSIAQRGKASGPRSQSQEVEKPLQPRFSDSEVNHVKHCSNNILHILICIILLSPDCMI